ncbi:serine/threonine-protein kinase [Streptomyces sp. NPDC126497]|uniref:serine/threonine-protein kinase n=1 Tax=Streptomyces sp. NPDC126497 TaxID=3155313 RepID=UPI00331F0E2C
MSIELPPVVPEDELPGHHPPMRLSYLKPRRVLRGGMSLVYLCDADPKGRGVTEAAVKRLSPEILAVPGTEIRFLRECYLWLQLGRHRNVVRALSAHEGRFEAPLLVLEYVPRSLRASMPEAGADLGGVLRTLIGVTDGLAHVRAALPGFVHADLKPENILVSADGTAKITDLGLAHVRMAAEAVAPAGHAGPARTTDASTDVAFPAGAVAAVSAEIAGGHASGLAGTPLYMAPEQIVSRRAVQESDVYALGCIAHEMISGVPAYGPPTSMADCLLRHLHAEPLPLDTARYPVPPALRTLIGDMLAKHPADRPELDHVRSVLRRVAAALGVDVSVPEPSPTEPGRQVAAAQGLLNIRLFEEAEETALKAKAGLEGRETVHARLIIARALTSRGRPEAALRELDEVAELLDEDTPAAFSATYYTERAHAERVTGDLPTAARSAARAIAAQPQYSRMYANAALIHQEMGELDKAIALTQHALGLAGDFSYFSGLANMLCEAERHEEALAVCDRMVEFHPTVGSAYAHRAFTRIVVHSAVGNGDADAYRALREAVAADFARARRYGYLEPEVRAAMAEFTAAGWGR